MQHTALVLTRSQTVRAGRPLRMINFLVRRGFRVVVMGRGEFTRDDVRYIRVDPPPPLTLPDKAKKAINVLLGRHEQIRGEAVFEQGLQNLQERDFSLIVCHDLLLLPGVLRMRGSARVLFDAREYWPRHFEHDRIWRLFEQPTMEYLCHSYLPRVDKLITVSGGIASEYKRVFGVEASIVYSCPASVDIAPSAVDPAHIRLIYHGTCAENRDILSMIRLTDLLDDRFLLDLMMVPVEANYYEQVVSEAARRPRVHILPPVAFHDIVPKTSTYDIGLFLAPPVTFNLTHCMPNKLFEFIQARLMVAIGPSPDMAALVRHYDVGTVARDFTLAAMAEQLNGLTAETIAHHKTMAHEAAKHLNAEENERELGAVVDSLLA